jgi:predicted ester cyclase
MNEPPTHPNPPEAKSYPASPTIVDRLRWNSTPELHETIRRLWIDHSKAEDSRNLDGLIATLASDCVYEIVPTGQHWEGHEGARQFYTSFLGAFPDVKFNLTDIVIGSQGVFEAAEMIGTQLGPWNGVTPTGEAVRTHVLIFFPWNPSARKFSGEKIWVDGMALGG